MHSLLDMNNIPHKHASAWDLRTEFKEAYELPRNLGKSLDMESSLIGRGLDDSQLHQSNSLESLPLVRRKSGSADSIPSLVQYSDLAGDFSTLAFSQCSSTITSHKRRVVRFRHHLPPRIPAHFKCVGFGIPKKEEVPVRGNLRLSDAHSRISKEWKKQQKLRRDHKLSDHIIEKWKKQQKSPRDHKLSDHIMAELVPSIAKLTCRDTEEEINTPGHF